MYEVVSDNMEIPLMTKKAIIVTKGILLHNDKYYTISITRMLRICKDFQASAHSHAADITVSVVCHYTVIF